MGSPCGTTIDNPSAAPRSDSTTRTDRAGPTPAAAVCRTASPIIVAVPASAAAPRMSPRRDSAAYSRQQGAEAVPGSVTGRSPVEVGGGVEDGVQDEGDTPVEEPVTPGDGVHRIAVGGTAARLEQV